MQTKLYHLARGCDNGACNIKAILNDLHACTQDMDQNEIRESLEIKYILGHVLFLQGVGLGPEQHIYERFQRKIELMPVLERCPTQATPAQRRAFENCILHQGIPKSIQYGGVGINDVIIVEVNGMVIGIEPDGYTHS